MILTAMIDTQIQGQIAIIEMMITTATATGTKAESENHFSETFSISTNKHWPLADGQWPAF
jgi:hypothetical protein